MGDTEPRTPKPELAAVIQDFDAVVEELGTGAPATREHRERYQSVSEFDLSDDPIVMPSLQGKFDHLVIGVGHPTLEAGETHIVEMRRPIGITARSQNPQYTTYVFRNGAADPLRIIDDRGEKASKGWEDVSSTDNAFGQRALLNLYDNLVKQVRERQRRGTLR